MASPPDAGDRDAGQRRIGCLSDFDQVRLSHWRSRRIQKGDGLSLLLQLKADYRDQSPDWSTFSPATLVAVRPRAGCVSILSNRSFQTRLHSQTARYCECNEGASAAMPRLFSINAPARCKSSTQTCTFRQTVSGKESPDATDTGRGCPPVSRAICIHGDFFTEKEVSEIAAIGSRLNVILEVAKQREQEHL